MGPNSMGYTIWGSTSGSPILGNYHTGTIWRGCAIGGEVDKGQQLTGNLSRGRALCWTGGRPNISAPALT